MSVIELKRRSRMFRLVRFWIPAKLVIPRSGAPSTVSPESRSQVKACGATTKANPTQRSRLASSNVAIA